MVERLHVLLVAGRFARTVTLDPAASREDVVYRKGRRDDRLGGGSSQAHGTAAAARTMSHDQARHNHSRNTAGVLNYDFNPFLSQNTFKLNWF